MSNELTLADISQLDLRDYNPEMTAEEFKARYGGIYQKDKGKRLSKSAMQRIWNKFVKEERMDFFKAHTLFTVYDIAAIGIDKFIYTMGWTKPSHVRTWRNNKIRVGLCGDCKQHFIPMLLQSNHGLCHTCRPQYSVKAMKNFILRELRTTERYYKAHRDCLMDFYIMFYNDGNFRKLFKKDCDFAQELEALVLETPEWAEKGEQLPALDELVDIEYKEIEKK